MNFNQLRDAFTQFWAARETREKHLLLAAAAVISVALIYLLLIEPALTARHNLAKMLPQLRTEVMQLKALAIQANSLNNVNATPAPAMSSASIEASLQIHQLKARSINLTGKSAQVQLDAVSFAQTLTWLSELQSGARVSVTSAKITPLATPDQVDASFTLQAAGADQ